MEKLIKDKIMEIQKEIRGLKKDGDFYGCGIIWREGYLNGKLKALEEILIEITKKPEPVVYVKEEMIRQTF